MLDPVNCHRLRNPLDDGSCDLAFKVKGTYEMDVVAEMEFVSLTIMVGDNAAVVV